MSTLTLRSKLTVLWLAATLCLGACGDKKSGDGNTSGAGGTSTAGVMAGAAGDGATAGAGAGAAGMSMVTAGTIAGGGTAGVSAGTTAGVETAGVGAGETGGTAGIPTGTDEYDPTEHCATGTYLDAQQFGRGTLPQQRTTCTEAESLAAGIPMGPSFPPLIVDSAELVTPMQENQPYSLSLEMSYDGLPSDGQVEIWGTQAQCGAGSDAKLLYKGMPVWKRQILCLDLMPEAAYTPLLLVVRFVGEDLKGAMSLIFDGATFCPTGSCPSK